MKQRNFVAALLLLFACNSVFAGKYQPAELIIDFENSRAGGDMYTVRFSSDEESFIGCGVRFSLVGDEVFEYGFCQAKNSDTKESVFCSTERPEMVEAISSIAQLSFITFGWDKSGECTWIGNSTQSFYIPKI
ncbi:hypothetical protein [Arenicella xantha]|uniref:Uncharacterized protein n=1 Tax=Arenicella xantha TaxID=644221 RepID=A0A395JPH7_9GAMM|nr:hypothetical protein [Arenicella xantha]RBP53544.1 hypothetical protein DFR28_101931 [Arenicella xantha]